MKETFTRQEVRNMLVTMFLFASANNNQGITSIKGQSYGEQAETVIEANESIIVSEKSMLSVLNKF